MSNGRFSAIVTVSVVVLALVGLPLAVLVVSPMTYSGVIERLVRHTSGLETRFESLDVGLFPLEVAVTGLELRNPDPAFEEPVLVADRLTASAGIGSYLASQPWWRTRGSGVGIRLERDASGRSNWAVDGADSDGDGSALPLEFTEIELTNLTLLRILDGEPHRFEFSQLGLKKDDDERLAVVLEGSYRDQPLQASGTLPLPTSERAREVAFHANLFGGELSLEGRVGHDGVTPGQARIDADFSQLTTLGVLVDRDLSRFEPLSLSGGIEVPSPGQWRLAVEGQVAGQPLQLRSQANLAGTAYDLRAFELIAGETLLEATGRIDPAQRELRGRIQAARVDLEPWLPDKADAAAPGGLPSSHRPSSRPADPAATSDWSRTAARWLTDLAAWSVNVEAVIEEFGYHSTRLQDLRVTATGGQHRLDLGARLRSLEASGGDGSSWQLVEPLTAAAQLRPADGDGGDVTGLRAHLATAGVRWEVEARLPLAQRVPARVSVRVDVRDLSAIDGPRLQALHPLLPVSIALEATGASSRWQLDPLTVGIAGGELAGALALDGSTTPPEVSGKLHASEIELRSVPTTAAAKRVQAEPDATPTAQVFSAEPIDWSWLTGLRMDVGVAVDRLDFNQTRFRDVRTHVRMGDGVLTVDPVTADLSKGGVRGHLRIRQAERGAAIDVRLVATELTPADLGQPDKGVIDGGDTDLLIDLRASGESAQQLAGSLSGEMAMEVQRATFRNSLLEIIGSDVLSETLSLVNPFVERDDRTRLECAAAHVIAEEGVLTSPNRMVFETSKMKIRAGGKVDLKDETLQIDFIPSARKGLGVSLSSLARFVRLGGTLADPHPEADPEGLITSGAKIGAAIATGGLSLVAQGLFDRARNQGTACGRIFERHTDVPEALEVADSSER